MDKTKSSDQIVGGLGWLFTAPVLLLLAWEFMARLNVISAIYFPSPLTVLGRFFVLLFPETAQGSAFAGDILFSLKRLFLGVLIAVPLAMGIGLAIGLNRGFSRFFMPLISLTYPIPKLAILPFLMIVLGAGDASKVAIIAIGIFYLVLLSIVHGLRSMPGVYADLAQVYCIPFSKRILFIVLMGILPDIFQGCKLGISYGLVMVVASEFIAARNGIGFFMWNAWDQFRITDVYVGLFVFSLLGWMIFAFFDWLTAGLKWRDRGRSW